MNTLEPVVAERNSLPACWESIVSQVAAGVPKGWELLYSSLFPLRLEILAKVGRDHGDDLYHDIIVGLVVAIRKGHLRTPEAAPAFARTILRRKACCFWREVGQMRTTLDISAIEVHDHSPDPEQQFLRRELRTIAARMMVSLSASQRELLTRFYIAQESPTQIQRSMRLSATQYRLMKSRAKAFFGARGRAYMGRNARAVSRSLGPLDPLPQTAC